MNKFFSPPSISPPLGHYSHGAETPPNARWLQVAGQVGVLPDGSVPDDMAGQSHAAWQNVVAVLKGAGMDVEDIVSLNHWLVEVDDFPVYAQVRGEYLGDHRPASTLMIVKALLKPNLKIEISAIAAKSAE